MRQLTDSAPRLRRCAPLMAAAALSLPLTSVSASAADFEAQGMWLATTASPTGDYVSRPDIDAPVLTTTTTGEETSGLLLTTPNPDNDQSISRGGIYDQNGELVWWSEPRDGGAHFDMEPITYEGEDALLLWEGRFAGGPEGEPPRYVILDESYQELASFAMQGYPTDGHDIEISADGTHAMMMSYVPVPYDLSPWGGPADASVIDVVIQEQEIATGEVTFEWRALDHITPDETYDRMDVPPQMGGAYDILHMNSLEYDADGNLLFSARSTDAVYKVDHDTGEILWRLGGKNNDFAFADAADMPSGQHDVRRLADGRLSLFDNGLRSEERVSRGAFYELDEENLTAELVGEMNADDPIFAVFAGSVRALDDDSQLLSYGSAGIIKEFEDGEEVFSAELEGNYLTYRAELADWHAQPTTKPDAVLGEVAEDGNQTMYMSYNGATDVAAWRIQAGPSEDDLDTVGWARKAGFETGAEFTPDEDDQVYKVTALGRFGQSLGSTTVTL